MVMAEASEQAESELGELTWGQLGEYRQRRYRRFAEGKVRSEEQARDFINDVGISLLFSAADIELPSLWDAINGRERPIPGHHHDHALSLTWDWKDSMPGKKWMWYGKLLRGKPMFVALDLLPSFYALSQNFGELDDYLQQYEDGKLSVEARQVYEALLQHGANSTNQLRKLSGMMGKGDTARRFERAIAELQVDLKIVKAGISDDNRWKYCYVYDLLLRRFPEVAEQARALSTRAARRTILLRYIDATGAAPAAAMPALFGWDPTITLRSVDELVADGSVAQARLTGMPEAGKKTTASRKPTTVNLANGDVLLVSKRLAGG